MNPEILTLTNELVAERFPESLAAMIAGSHVRGRATTTSDIDLIVLMPTGSRTYRESFLYEGHPVEAFIYTEATIADFFEADRARRRPSLQRMVAEAVPVRVHPLVDRLKAEASRQLLAGPTRWTVEQLNQNRYFLTDLLDDFIGVEDRTEGLAIATRLFDQAAAFHLTASGRWLGQGKWLPRELAALSQADADRFTDAFERYFRHDEKQPVIQLIETWLTQHGGRHFDGFSIGK
ncbi:MULTISPECIES: nucleotidyltransferase domain-containing protein [unclassified Exiguobacterium]|uniref:nucleotidyltransferase domain-containing protein n=1 Tax=unclassified Exiguobacterium TaxID=2644629 RepID=UPI001BE73792|nr:MULTISPECIES: nucleotidyltransferase domain-containing protein [unclassified Exiguobacterium]